MDRLHSKVLLLHLLLHFISTTHCDPLEVLPDYITAEANSQSHSLSRISEWTDRLTELYWSTFGRLTPLKKLEHQIARYGFRLRVHYGWRNVSGLGLHQYPRVCDRRIGCIQLDLPAENVSTAFEAAKRMKMKRALQYVFLPFSPDKLKTRFIAYREEAPDTEQEIVTTLPATFQGVVDPQRRVVILTHGFTDDYHKVGLQSIKRSLLKFSKGQVGTVIMVDWHRGSYYAAIKNFTSDDYYSQAVANTQVIGRQIADLVNELRLNLNLDPGNVYLVGHSLGAQTSGTAGSWGQETFGWQLGRITGLDPAGPLFYMLSSYLKAGDAAFVDIIHTSAFKVQADAIIGRLGYPTPTGDLDFFPNGGSDQPNCQLAPGEVLDPNAPSCMHQTALWFYDASLNSTDQCTFDAYPAANYSVFLASYQEGSLEENSPSDTLMGYWANSEARGARYLLTGKHFPYCQLELED